MRPRIESSIGDDAMDSCGYLRFTDDKLQSSFLQALSTMRKHRLFCDVILHVGSSEIHAHRNVLACVSPHLMDLFSAEQENATGGADGSIPSYRLNGYINKDGFKYLLDYAYTACLEVPDDAIKDVYLAAWQLKIERVVNECARHLIAELTPETCIDTRSLPGINRNTGFVKDVDAYILKEFSSVSLTPSFLQLPCVQIEVLYQTKQEIQLVTESSLSRLVLDWIKRQITEDNMAMNHLLERSHLLYLALDNSLQDCSDLPSGHESDTVLVQDYKRLVIKCPNNKSRRKCLAVPVRPRVIIYSRDIGERVDDGACLESDWDMIGTTKVCDNIFISLVTLNGSLTRISVQLRLNTPTSPSPINTPADSTVFDGVFPHNEEENVESQPELFCEVAPMSAPKCGLGVAEWNGKLLVCGGYDRAECLRSVESYCPISNTWTTESKMSEARGRVQIAVINDTVYAVGGSNGSTELDTVESFTKADSKWKKCCKLPLARSNAGVASLNNTIYCIGGWNGQSGIKQCDLYKPEENKWISIASLHTGRYQAGAAAFNNNIFVVGGSDGWNCLSTVEKYDPEIDQWKFATSLLTPRRGCGLAEFNNKLYVVGGSDGTHSLSSTEYYDDETKTWTVGPNLTTPRANVSVVVVGDRLYAIGGFSGKTFLNTIEYLDSNSNEWTTFVPQNSATSTTASSTASTPSKHDKGESGDTLDNNSKNSNGFHKYENGSNGKETNGSCDNLDDVKNDKNSNKSGAVNGHLNGHNHNKNIITNNIENSIKDIVTQNDKKSNFNHLDLEHQIVNLNS